MTTKRARLYAFLRHVLSDHGGDVRHCATCPTSAGGFAQLAGHVFLHGDLVDMDQCGECSIARGSTSDG